MEQVGRVPGKYTTKELAARQCVFRITQGPQASDESKGRQHVGASSSEHQSRSASGPFHARKSHKKSHLGCQNCKKRRIKCDERQPTCQKCERHGLPCVYQRSLSQHSTASTISSPTPSRHGSGSGQMVRTNPWQSASSFTMSIPMAGSYIEELLGPDRAHLDPALHVQILHHFTTQAYSTIGEGLAQTNALQIVPSLATSHPVLMHAVLGFAALHMQHLLSAEDQSLLRSQYNFVSSYHWSRALALFQTALMGTSSALQANMDVILSTCLFLNTRSMSLVDEPAPGLPMHAVGNTSTNVFTATESSLAADATASASSQVSTSFVYSPTTHHAHHALTWLYMQSGTMTLILTFEKHLPLSIWAPVFNASDDEHGTYSDDRIGREGLPRKLADLFDINPGDTAETNSYHKPLRLMVPLLRLYVAWRQQPSRSSLLAASPSHPFKAPSASPLASPLGASASTSYLPFATPDDLTTPSTTTDFFFTKTITWPGRIRPDFRILLAERDPRALLLMGCWCAMAADVDTWWVHGRARSEGRAICDFLDRQLRLEAAVTTSLDSYGEDGSRANVMQSMLGWIARRVGYVLSDVGAREKLEEETGAGEQKGESSRLWGQSGEVAEETGIELLRQVLYD